MLGKLCSGSATSLDHLSLLGKCDTETQSTCPVIVAVIKHSFADTFSNSHRSANVVTVGSSTSVDKLVALRLLSFSLLARNTDAKRQTTRNRERVSAVIVASLTIRVRILWWQYW